VDWEEARIDDPAFDVAYARLDMQLTLAGDAPDRLLAGYEARRGPLHAVAFWDLIGALPAFRWLDDWAAGYREVGRTELSRDVAEPCKRRAIRHHARERHLRRALSRVAFEDREADRSVDRTIHDVARDAWSPVRLVVKETPHEVAVDVSRVARNDVVPHARRV